MGDPSEITITASWNPEADALLRQGGLITSRRKVSLFSGTWTGLGPGALDGLLRRHLLGRSSVYEKSDSKGRQYVPHPCGDR